MTSPTVSVVIPTHNRAHMIGRAIRSVQAQTFSDWELLVVDDASSDDTGGVVAAFGDRRIRLIRHETNRGAPAARNTGIDAARGEFVAFLDSDDEWLPRKLEAQLALLQSGDPARPDVALCQIILKTAAQEVLEQYPLRGNVLDELLRFATGLATTPIMVRRSCLDSGIRFDEAFPAYQDWDLLVQLATTYTFAYVDEPLCVLHIHGGERITNPSRHITALRMIMKKYEAELKKRPSVRAAHHYKIARRLIFVGDLPGARSEIAASLRAWPWSARRWFLLATALMGSRVFSRVYGRYQRAGRWRKLGRAA